MSSSSSSMRESAASFILIGLSPADSDTRRRKVKADLASHTAPKRVATQLIAWVGLGVGGWGLGWGSGSGLGLGLGLGWD
jgi:hypothetical protein